MSPFKEKEAYFRRLLDVANVNALSPKERATYDENLKIYRDWKATMEYAVEEAETKGKAAIPRIRPRTPKTQDFFGASPLIL